MPVSCACQSNPSRDATPPYELASGPVVSCSYTTVLTPDRRKLAGSDHHGSPMQPYLSHAGIVQIRSPFTNSELDLSSPGGVFYRLNAHVIGTECVHWIDRDIALQLSSASHDQHVGTKFSWGIPPSCCNAHEAGRGANLPTPVWSYCRDD